MNNILLIVEGEKDEAKLFQKLFDKFLPNSVSYNIYSYKTNIYQLYIELRKDKFLDLLPILKNNKRNNSKENEILSKNYTDIYLIFDYEKKAHHFDANSIKEMLSFFNNETENGMLYINYPLLESYKDFTRSNYSLRRYLDFSKLSQYKAEVNRTSEIKNINTISHNDYLFFIYNAICKRNYLLDNLNEPKFTDSTFENYIRILNYQNKILKENSLIIFASSILIIVDYSKKVFDFIIKEIHTKKEL